jgi:hypothetical protein
MATEETTPLFEVGDEVSGGGSARIVQSREWKNGSWVYVCAPKDPKSKLLPLPFPEKMLKKPEPRPELGRMIITPPRS